MATAVKPVRAPEPEPRVVRWPLAMAGTLAFVDLCTLLLAVFGGFRIWNLVNPAIPKFQLRHSCRLFALVIRLS